MERLEDAGALPPTFGMVGYTEAPPDSVSPSLMSRKTRQALLESDQNGHGESIDYGRGGEAMASGSSLSITIRGGEGNKTRRVAVRFTSKKAPAGAAAGTAAMQVEQEEQEMSEESALVRVVSLAEEEREREELLPLCTLSCAQLSAHKDAHSSRPREAYAPPPPPPN